MYKRGNFSSKIITRLLISILLIMVNICGFTLTTYAWFSDTATVGGSKVYAGNLFVDVVADEETLEKYGFVVNDEEKYVEDSNGNQVKMKVYTRVFEDDGDVETKDYKNYYVLSDVQAPIVNIHNIEPGQAYPVHFDVFNGGDLAIKCSAGFQLNREDPNYNKSHLLSYTGLETLEKQNEGDPNFGVFHNVYQINESGDIHSDPSNSTKNPSDPRNENEINNTLDSDEYDLRKKELELMQLDEDGNDIGGHLEDILEVYAVDKDSYDEDGNITKDAIKSENYIGTVAEIIDLDSNSEIRNRLMYHSKAYCLPKDVVTHDGYSSRDNNIKTIIYNNNNEEIGSYDNVSEMGSIDYIIYMPEDASNIYQNATIFLDIGVTASQVEFEYDGTGCMIYDQSYEKLLTGDLIGLPYDGDGAENGYIDAMVLDSYGNGVYAVVPKAGFDTSEYLGKLSNQEVNYFDHHVKYVDTNVSEDDYDHHTHLNTNVIYDNNGTTIIDKKIAQSETTKKNVDFFGILADDDNFSYSNFVTTNNFAMGYVDYINLINFGLINGRVDSNTRNNCLAYLGYSSYVVDVVKALDDIEVNGTTLLTNNNLYSIGDIDKSQTVDGFTGTGFKTTTPNNSDWENVDITVGTIPIYLVDLSSNDSYIIRGLTTMGVNQYKENK